LEKKGLEQQRNFEKKEKKKIRSGKKDARFSKEIMKATKWSYDEKARKKKKSKKEKPRKKKKSKAGKKKNFVGRGGGLKKERKIKGKNKTPAGGQFSGSK